MRDSIVTIQVSPENLGAVQKLMSLCTEGFIPDGLMEMEQSEAMYTVALVGPLADHLLAQLADAVRMGEIETLAEAKAEREQQFDLQLGDMRPSFPTGVMNLGDPPDPWPVLSQMHLSAPASVVKL